MRGVIEPETGVAQKDWLFSGERDQTGMDNVEGGLFVSDRDDMGTAVELDRQGEKIAAIMTGASAANPEKAYCTANSKIGGRNSAME